MLKYIIIAMAIAWPCLGQVQVESPRTEWAEEAKAILSKDSLGQTLPSAWRTKMQKAGFWLCSYRDSVLYTGAKLKVGEIILDNRKNSAKDLVLNQSNWQSLLEKSLQFEADQGYPFASIEIESYLIREEQLYAQATVNKGPYLSFDSLVVLGYEKVSPRLLCYEIDWQKGRAYSDRYLEDLEKNLNASEYLSASRPPAVAFYADQSHVYLYLQKRQSNQVSGIVGLNTEAEGETTLNGDFKLNLLNTFDRGESIGLRWRSPTSDVQDFSLQFAYPYLWGSPIGISTDFSLFRQDSSFIRREFGLGLNYRLAYQAFFDLGFNYKSSNALNDASDQFQALGDYENLGLNLGFRLIRLDQRIVAQQGYAIMLNLGSGQRQAQGEEWQQYSWQGEFAYYQKMGSRLVWHQNFSSAGLGGSPLFENELERLGGINSLRGFNELSLFSNAYGLARNELRYMLGPFDYLCLFFDGAYSQKRVLDGLSEDFHSGWGAGINFQTNGGIFSLFLAVGQSNEASYDYRSTKVHLSYVNSF